MSDQAAAVLGAVLGFQASAIVFLAYAVSRFRERLARLEQALEDRRRCEGPRGPAG